MQETFFGKGVAISPISGWEILKSGCPQARLSCGVISVSAHVTSVSLFLGLLVTLAFLLQSVWIIQAVQDIRVLQTEVCNIQQLCLPFYHELTFFLIHDLHFNSEYSPTVFICFSHSLPESCTWVFKLKPNKSVWLPEHRFLFKLMKRVQPKVAVSLYRRALPLNSSQELGWCAAAST